MKGVILHGGLGTRLRPLTFSGPKQLIPVANKPVSQYVLESLKDSGIKDIAIVLGDIFPELVKNYYEDGNKLGVNISYIYQGKPLGIAHAIGLCRDFVGEEPFVVHLGDNLLELGIKPYLQKFMSSNPDAMALFKEVDDPSRFGVPEFDREGKLIRLIEKPKEPPSKYALVGVYFLTPVIFKMIDRLKPSWRGEYEITEALQMLIDRGYQVVYEFVQGWWLDTGKKDDILQANVLILDQYAKREILGEVVDSHIIGRVKIEEGSKVVNSTIRGPTVIGKNCLIENSFIGPYASVGNNARIVNSLVEYCVILENALIKDVARLEESLVGKSAKVIKAERRITRLNIGDYSEVEV